MDDGTAACDINHYAADVEMSTRLRVGDGSLAFFLLFLVGTAALVGGIYGRFVGLATWPFGVDEYYVSRSVDNIMRVGLPSFSCGGYYTRGLLYQYLVAGMREGGLQPEFAGRLLAALSSLAVLPPAYVLARRLAGPLAGCLTVMLLCISVWEIEMARFARMYAPFQGVFTWYLVFYLRYVVDRDGVALRFMIVLSVVGVLLWEGGVFLGAINILAVLLTDTAQPRKHASDARRLAGLVLLLGLLFLLTRDLRGFADLPAAASGAGTSDPPLPLELTLQSFASLARQPLWLAGFLVPLALSCAALPWMWSLRNRRLAAVGFCVVLGGAVSQLFVLSLGVLAMMRLAGLIEANDLAARGARYFVAACVAFLFFWASFHHGAVVQLFGFPNVYETIIRPWGRSVAVLAAALGLAIAFWFYTALRTARRPPDAVAALLIVLIAVTLAVGAAATERVETRYTFFLYPLLLVFGVGALVETLKRRGAPMLAVAWAPLVCFAASEDFQPQHVLRIDSARVNFRTGMSPARAAHYYPRGDIRGVGQWLGAHRQQDALVVAGIPSLEQYYPNFDYFFLDDQDQRYEAYVCKNGTTERWTDHPVLYGMRALKSLVATGRPVYATVYADDEARLRAAAPSEGWAITSVWTSEYGNADVLMIAPKASAPSTP